MSAGPAKNVLGIGLISVGWMGRLHSRAYGALPYHYPELPVRPRLVIAADADPERAEYAADVLGYAAWTVDWREVIGHPDVGAISIAAPNYLHREMAVAAASAGRHFWIEKPVGCGVADAQAVAGAADAADVRTAVGFNYRHAPSVQYGRELIRSGRLGRITHAHARFLNDYAADPDCVFSWRFSRDRSGYGVLGDLMTHVIDLLQYLVAPVRVASATTEIYIPQRPLPDPTRTSSTHFDRARPGGPTAAVDTDDYAAGVLRLAGGAIATVEASRVSVGPQCQIGFEIYGTDGSIRWDFERMNELQVCCAGDSGYRNVRAGPGQGDYTRFQPGPAIAMGYDDLKTIEAQLFVRSIVTGESAGATVADALSAARVVQAMHVSSKSGRWEPVTPSSSASS